MRGENSVKTQFKKGNKVNLGKKNALGHKYDKEIYRSRAENRLGKPLSEKWLENIRAAGLKRRGIKLTPEWIKNRTKSQKGLKRSIETRKKLSDAKKGEKSYLWKGGISVEHKKIRAGVEFKLWREAIYKRDNYTCQKYGTVGGKLHPHHILNFSSNPELRFAIDNGITLSVKAHKLFHKIYGVKNNTREQLVEFINNKNI